MAVVLAIAAGALGAGVADRLDPYGADDPATESVKAADQLERAGYRETGVVVLVDDVDVDSAAGRERIEGLTERIRGDEDVAGVASFYTTGSRAFVSRDGSSTYLSVQLSPTDDDEIEDAGERISAALEDEPGVVVGGGSGRPAAGERAGRGGPAHGRALRLPDPVPAVLALLPQPGRRRAPAARRWADDRQHHADAERGEWSGLDLDLRAQPRDRSRARAVDRLQPVHRLAVPRGDRQDRPRARGHAAHDGDRRAHGPVQRADRRRRARVAARLPAALPLLDGRRRIAGRADRRGGRADRAAGHPRPPRNAGERSGAGVPARPRRARRPARRARLLVPALAARDAVPGPDRHRQRRRS